MFLFSVKVMEEVKSDALYEFQPPFNILAGIFVWPCSLFYPPEVVGRVSRVLLRFFFFPELVCIWLFETLVMQKQNLYLPVRPGIVDHEGAYGAALSSRDADSAVAGGVAKRRQAASNEHVKASQVESTQEEGESLVEPGGTITEDPFQTVTPQRLHRLTTNGLNTNNPSENDILSPYFENIRRFRDASKSNSTTSLRSGSEHDQDQMPYTPYSYHPPVPIGAGLGLGRQGSISGYGRVHQGTEATLANTYQSMWPPHGMAGDMASFLDSGSHFPQSSQQQHQSQHQQWFMDQETATHQNQQQPLLQSNDAQELARLMEDRFSEMRIRMEEMESKMERLINAIIVANDNKS